jgi:mannosyltransferase
MVVHIHFHSHKTGVTRSVENIIPVLNRYTEARVFGYGIDAQKISLLKLLKLIYSPGKPVIHAHRNNEIIFALLMRTLGGKFKLIFTRHAESRPSGFTVWLMRKADNVVSLSTSMSKDLNCRNTLIPHGIDTEIFNIHEKTGIAGIGQEKIISVIGRIRAAKGQLVVLKALTGLLGNNPGWGLALIGKIDENEYSDKIISLASEKGISSQVHFLPESDDIISYYRASNAVVIASVSEGFSLVCLEAMACGLITIATESVGIHSEVIRHGENGFLFPLNDHESLRRILADVMSGKINIDKGKIRQTIVDKWSVEKNVKELMRLYASGAVNTDPHRPKF